MSLELQDRSQGIRRDAVTEADWLTCADPQKMLEFLRATVSDRKLRLFACACVRRVWHLLTDEESRHCVATAERFADGAATKAERHEAGRAANRVVHSHYPVTTTTHQAWSETHGVGEATELLRLWASFSAATAAAMLSSRKMTRHPLASSVAIEAASAVWQATCPPKLERPWEKNRQAALVWSRERRTQCRLVRDIFNPFRPIRLNPTWQTPEVVSRAQAIYDDRAFDRLPILADALEEAGCHRPDILTHCRQPGEHVRGCWVLDLLLGKS